MKTVEKVPETDPGLDMAPEYDFSKGVRGKYSKRFRAGSKVVVIAPDVAHEFQTSQDVNNALRRLAKAEQEVLAIKKKLAELKKSLRTRVAAKATKRTKHPVRGKGNRG